MGVHAATDMDAAIRKALRLFNQGRYDEAEDAWRRVTEDFPDAALGFQNLATVELINTASKMRLDALPAVGPEAEQLERCLAHFRRARALASSVDAVALNNEGNALGLLGQYPDALEAYRKAADAADRDFEAVPRANAALTLLQVGRPAEGARLAEAIVRRDPNFVDGFAILAACRWREGRPFDAERAYIRLCQEPAWCARYATADVVTGRWPPAAVAAWQEFLRAGRAAPERDPVPRGQAQGSSATEIA